MGIRSGFRNDGRFLRERPGRRSSTRGPPDRLWPQQDRHPVLGRGVRGHQEPRARGIRQNDIRPRRPRCEAAPGRWPPPVGPLWRSCAYILAGERCPQERRTDYQRLHEHANFQPRGRTRHLPDRVVGPRCERQGSQGYVQGCPGRQHPGWRNEQALGYRAPSRRQVGPSQRRCLVVANEVGGRDGLPAGQPGGRRPRAGPRAAAGRRPAHAGCPTARWQTPSRPCEPPRRWLPPSGRSSSWC